MTADVPAIILGIKNLLPAAIESSGATLRLGRQPPECGSDNVLPVDVVNDRRTHVLILTRVIRFIVSYDFIGDIIRMYIVMLQCTSRQTRTPA